MKILKDSLTFSSSRYLLMGLSAVRNLVLAKVLDPEHYGYWVILALVLAYGDQVHGGLRHAGDREIPFLKGQGKDREAVRVTQVLFSGILMFSGCAFLLLSLAGFSGVLGLTLPRHLLALAGLIVVGEQVSRFSFMILRTRLEFVRSSRIEIGFEVIRTGLVCWLAAWKGVEGALFAFLFTSLANILYFATAYRLPPRPVYDRTLMKLLLGIGGLLFAVSVVQLLLFNMDRIIGALTLTKAELGMYGLAALIAQIPIAFSQSVSAVFVPNASEGFARRRSVDDISRLFLRFLRTSAILGPAFSAFILIAARPILIEFLPAYQLSAPVLMILIPAGMFAVLIPPASALLVIARRAGLLLVLETGAVIGSCIIFLLAFRITTGLQAVSTGMVAATLWHSALSIAGALRVCRLAGPAFLKESLINYAPSIYAIIMLFGIIPLIQGDVTSAGDCLRELAIFSLLYLPVLWIGYRVLRRPTGTTIPARAGS